MSCDPEDDKGGKPPRTKRGDPAGPDAWFPNVPRRDHAKECVRSPSTYTCSCGVTEASLAAGDFVRYDPHIGPEKGTTKPEGWYKEFLTQCVSDSAALDMAAFNKRA